MKCTLHNISAKYVSRFLEVVGNHIRRLTVTIGEDCDTDTVINFFLEVQNYCFNLKHITIKKWKFLNFDKFEVMISRLTSLRLEECRFYDKHIIAHRRLAINPWITSPISFNSLYPPLCTKTNFFGSEILPMITSLELYECDCIQPEMFVDFLRGNNQLTHISLFRLSVFKKQMYNANFFNEMSKHMKNVERFSIDVDTSSEIQFISHLPNLRSLQLMNYSVANEQVVDTLLRKLAVRDTIIELDLYHCNLARQTFRTISELKKLTSLKLCKNFWVTEQHFKMCLLMPNLKKFCCFDCIQLSDEGLISIIKMAPNMETLDCSWCFQVTNRFIYDVSKDAKRLKLDILAGGRTKMTESILEVN